MLVLFAGVAHLVERHLAKVEVASSSLVTRSNETVSAIAEAVFYCAGKTKRPPAGALRREVLRGIGNLFTLRQIPDIGGRVARGVKGKTCSAPGSPSRSR